MPYTPKSKINQYSKESFQKALEEIENGAQIRPTSKKYGIPRATLQDRIQGRVSSDKLGQMGPDPYLSLENENKIVNWIIQLAKCGFPIKKQELLDTVQKIVKQEKIKTPFKNGRPGQKWYKSFLHRHPKVSARNAESIDKSRAKITEEYIKVWFRDLLNFLQEKEATSILTSPSRMFNADESGFSLCPKTGKVLGLRGYKNFFEIKKGSEKENLTVLVTFSADGNLCPPCVVFPYVKPRRAVAESMPPNWILGRSESGWMKSDVFYEYVANGLNPWIESQGIKKPVLFLVDGHRSHMSIELSKFCDDNDIFLYALPPNSTHIMQPADVGLFKPLKEYWRQAVRSWQNNHEGMCVTRTEFTPIFKEALNNPNNPDHIRKAFRRCGLFPYNPEAVDYSKCVQNKLESIQLFENKDEGILNSNDFETTYKVLGHFRSGINILKHADLDSLVAELKEYEKKILKNIELDKNKVLNEPLEIVEYEVNDDGYLLPVAEEKGEKPKINILQIDIISPKDNVKSIIPYDEPEVDPSVQSFQDKSKDNKVKPTDEESLEDGPLKTIEINDFSGIEKKVNSFKNHLKYPKPLEKTKRNRSEPLPSAISSEAWRSYYIEKENIKLEKENMRKRKREELEKRKLEKGTKKKQKIEKNNEKNEIQKQELVKKKEKCAVCEDQLESDAEEEGEKNVGCDTCPRWFHLNCTKLTGQSYDSISGQEFFCDFCIDDLSTDM